MDFGNIALGALTLWIQDKTWNAVEKVKQTLLFTVHISRIGTFPRIEYIRILSYNDNSDRLLVIFTSNKYNRGRIPFKNQEHKWLKYTQYRRNNNKLERDSKLVSTN